MYDFSHELLVPVLPYYYDTDYYNATDGDYVYDTGTDNSTTNMLSQTILLPIRVSSWPS